MHRSLRIKGQLQKAVVVVALLSGALGATAQPAAASGISLKEAFDAAWARQPEAQALQARRDAARARQQAASAWTPEPPALGLAGKSDRLNDNRGAREIEVGLSVPIWLPGERGQSVALAEAEDAALESRTAAARLRIAATVRNAWWGWERARIDADSAREQLHNASRIAADVVRRLKAGDLARADQHQADGAVAAAESAVAQAEAVLALAAQQLKAATGWPSIPTDASALHRAEPDVPAQSPEGHAALRDLESRASVADRAAALLQTQSRANPELALLATRERGDATDVYRQTITLGIRIPFGGGARHDAKVASARAEATEAQAQLTLERERLRAEREAARVRVDATRSQLASAERRAQLARESRGFFDKSFKLGETDLPTRLRIEAEAADAERQAARAQVELAAAISAWRQTLGLLPQ